jgi:glutamine synthetase
VSQLPEVSKDSTDRNRTSPFAFTGNKFEFRAVGSSASPAFPVTCLNAAVADGISEVIARLKAKGVNGTDGLDKAILEVVAEFAKSTKSVRFEGNGYSEDWKTEAEKRGLPHLRKTPEALAEIVSASSVKLFSEFNIFSKDEVHSRYHVRVERYLKNMLIEADSLRQIVDTSILPAGFDYYGKVCNSMQAALAAKLPTPQASHANQLAGLLSELQKQRQALEVNLAKVESTTSESEKAKLLAYETAVIMEDIRKTSDSLEAIVADDCWPLPKYREMLFLS